MTTTLDSLIGQKMDCWTLVHKVYAMHNRQLPYSYLSIFANKDPQEIDAIIRGYKPLFKRLDGPRPLALVAFYGTPPYVCHVGVVDETGTRVIHATEKYGVVVTPIAMLQKVEGYYEWLNS